MHPTGIIPVGNIPVNDVTEVIPLGVILPIPTAPAQTRRASFIDGCSPLTLIIDLPISKFPTFIGQQPSRSYIPKTSISRNRSLYIKYMSSAISCPNNEVAWLKFLALPLLLFTPSQQLTTRHVMDKLALDDWQSFFLSHPRPSHPSHTDHPLPSTSSLQLRCAKLVESGNLGKAFQLISSPSSITSLTPAETIALLQAQHPPRNIDSFTPAEQLSVSAQPPLIQQHLPDFTTNSVVAYLRHASNCIAPGYDKLRIEHLKTLSGCNNPLPSADELLFIEQLTTILNIIKNGQLSPLILVAFRDSHIIALPKGTTGTRPIGLALLYRKMVSALSKRFIQEDLRLSFRNLQFGTSSRGSEIIIHSIRSIMDAHPDYDVLFADGINAFNSASRTQTLLHLKDKFPEAYSFFHQFYGSASDLWHSLDPTHITSIPSAEGFQQGDPASTLLYCTAIHDFLQDLQHFLLDQGSAIPLFFVDDGTLIGPHALILSAIGFINTHGIRVGYRLNPIKSKLLLGQCNSFEESFQHRQAYLDLGFSPTVIHSHPINDPTSVVCYGYKLLGSFVGSDDYILHALSTYIVQLNSLADRLITLCVHYQHLLALLRHCFLTKVSHVFRTIPPRLTFVFATQVNDICYRIFCSMTSHLHPTLSALHIHQLHLNLDDGGFSLPNMLLTRQSAYLASFSQCLSSTVDIINLLHPFTLDDIPLGYHHHIHATAQLPDNSFFNLPHSSFSDYFQSISQFQAQHPTMNIATIMSTHRHDSKLQHSLYMLCYSSYLSSFHVSLHAVDNPTRVANYYTLLGKDESLALKVVARLGFYSVANVLFQSIILRRLFLRQPTIPVGRNCSCSTTPLIDVEGRHFTTGCGLRGVRQSTSRAITQSLAYICHYSNAPCTFEDRHVLRAADENEGLRPDLTVSNAPNYNVPLLVDVSVVQSFPGSKNPSAPLPRRPPEFYSTLSLQHRTSHSAYNDKVNKYQRACNTNGVSFLPFIMESNGFIHPTSKLFLEDLAKQASFFRHIPWSNLLQFFLSILSVSLQSALSRAIITHTSCLNPPPPLLAVLSDADISTVHLFS